jgi:hypothetical protein
MDLLTSLPDAIGTLAALSSSAHIIAFVILGILILWLASLLLARNF